MIRSTALLFVLALTPCCGESQASPSLLDVTPDNHAELMRSVQQMASDQISGTIGQLHQIVEGIASAPVVQTASVKARETVAELQTSFQQLEQLRTQLAELPDRFATESPRLIAQIRTRLDSLTADQQVTQQLAPLLNQLRARLRELQDEAKR